LQFITPQDPGGPDEVKQDCEWPAESMIRPRRTRAKG
jgi:hypothetical protein